MRAAVVRLVAALVLAVCAGSSPARAADPPLEPRALGAAREAARWVARQAQPANGKGVATFPEYAESAAEVPSAPLYAGSAGVLVFLENAAAVLDDDALRALADRTAAGLLTESGKPRTGAGAAGLYTGDAGTAWALLVRWRLRKDRAALEGAQRIADALLARTRTGDDAGSWDDGYDIISGAAGTALLLLEVAADAETDADRRRYADGALRAGRFLARRGAADTSDPATNDRRLWWPTGKGQTRHYPNFSHGTAGVAYALARIAGATGDAECRDAAVAGGRWLLAHARRAGTTLAWSHYLPGHEDLLM
jgi:lantibiotic modifying enzyme